MSTSTAQALDLAVPALLRTENHEMIFWYHVATIAAIVGTIAFAATVINTGITINTVTIITYVSIFTMSIVTITSNAYHHQYHRWGTQQAPTTQGGRPRER